MTDLLAMHRQMTPSGVKLNVVVDANVPDTVVLDPLRVHQVLTNGLTNAIKVCGARPGRVWFVVKCEPLAFVLLCSFVPLTAHRGWRDCDESPPVHAVPTG